MVMKSLDTVVMNLERKIGPFAVIVAQLGGKEMEWTLDKKFSNLLTLFNFLTLLIFFLGFLDNY
jgi:hypothetical protein